MFTISTEFIALLLIGIVGGGFIGRATHTKSSTFHSSLAGGAGALLATALSSAILTNNNPDSGLITVLFVCIGTVLCTSLYHLMLMYNSNH